MTGPGQPSPQSASGTGSPPVSEAEARRVAEEAREDEWLRPSFGKQLFLGDFQLGLIHPHPAPDPESERARSSASDLRSSATGVNGAIIERDAKIPDEVVKGLADLGAFGMKISPEYGGLGLSQLYYNRALMIVSSSPRRWAPCCPRTSRSASPSRWRCSAPRSRSSASCRAAPAARSARSC